MFLRLFTLLLVAILAGCAHQGSVQQSGQDPYVAVDTSRTIDLTNPPADIWDRIRRGFAIPNLNDPLVDHWTNYYASHPQSVYRMSERARRYLYFIVDELERRGMPTELALLPFVESAYNPEAYSRAKASGLWQFIPSTGLHYNLKQDQLQDQRRDPIASTHAALEYLNYLYEFQGDWYLALASYNWGEGSVKRAIERAEEAGDGTDYLSLKMPDETRNYVPKLQAIKNIITNPRRYGMTLPHVGNTPYFTSIRKTHTMAVEDVAKLAEIPVEEFKALNASFNQDIIVADNSPVILLPANRVDIFKANLEAHKHKLDTWKPYNPGKGEALSAIAQKHNISLARLRDINGLDDRDTRANGQVLWVPATTGTGLQIAASSTSVAGLPPVGTPVPRARRHVGPDVQSRNTSALSTHTVRKGDTLFSLARRYNTSVNELRRLNNLKGNSLDQGKRLKVPGKGRRS
ncbi:MAG: transglycosylase SLT domain-containing protein [Alcaligenaceae bacterium]|nr:transglycosylase SLT domain-containing protein [Alcaligenaceae bacterium]